MYRRVDALYVQVCSWFTRRRPPAGSPSSAGWLALTQRYLTDRLTAEEIGQLCGWSSQYIRDRLRDHGIPLRPPGTHRRIRRTLDRDTLTSWLHDGGTVQQISNRSGYTTSGIYKLLHQHQLT